MIIMHSYLYQRIILNIHMCLIPCKGHQKGISSGMRLGTEICRFHLRKFIEGRFGIGQDFLLNRIQLIAD